MESKKHNCIEYVITEKVSIWEIKHNNEYDYYVTYGNSALEFVFGVPLKDRFAGEDLDNLYMNGYFDNFIRALEGGNF